LIVNEIPISESDKKTISPENQSRYKTIQEKTVGGEKVYIIDVDIDLGRSLAESIQNLGPIMPIYYMADGVTLVDGFHRLAECPNAQYTKIILKNCVTEVDRVLYSTAINFNRRKGTSEELKKNIVFLATEGHLSVNEIVSKIGLSHSTVDRYYPKELKDQAHSQLGIASGKARALKATQQTQTARTTRVGASTESIAHNFTHENTCNGPQVNAPGIAPNDAKPKESICANTSNEKEPALSDNSVPTWERRTQEPTSEEKINTLIAEDNEEQQQLEKLICDAKADLPSDFKHAVYDLAVDPAKELTQKKLNECLTVAVEVLLDFIEREGTLQDLLKTASERW
jgi:hypothetical protein